MQVIVQRRAA